MPHQGQRYRTKQSSPADAAYQAGSLRALRTAAPCPDRKGGRFRPCRAAKGMKRISEILDKALSSSTHRFKLRRRNSLNPILIQFRIEIELIAGGCGRPHAPNSKSVNIWRHGYRIPLTLCALIDDDAKRR